MGIDGVVIPGGESTTIGKLLRDWDILPTLKRMIADGKELITQTEVELSRFFRTAHFFASHSTNSRFGLLWYLCRMHSDGKRCDRV
mmetsp:Transcript_4183/g.17755  ORF Transcript_4183/g.17755 Transcript_4183/m.17755 type:complete len:86 (+) Transcript_4183:359-616(+)